ncbi:hypothetical protein JMJ55_04480 [Belnapia sp. T6]|uniref:ABM domain-containing protein n=1 Tax=Belnapia mucosa TaxID=2804532 RepID=A0ABS1UYN0_9PROT|nr:hypothetical protein [Belnapia mucosa]MBL6454569.1 hypothetical protein [Belnapia mucosa]
MYLMIRKHADKAAAMPLLAPRVRDSLVPLLKQAPGFAGYCVFASEDGHAVSVTLFDDQQTALRAEAQVHPWMVSALGDIVADPPEIVAGNVLVAEEVPPMRLAAGDSLFVVVRYYDGLTSSPDWMARWVRANILPPLREQAGFRGFYNFSRDGDGTRGGSVILWHGRESAVQSGKLAALIDAAKLTGIAWNRPDVMIGRTAVSAAM